MRGLVSPIEAAKLPIWVNILAPSWSNSSIFPAMKPLLSKIGVETQPASALACATGLLMADTSRNGHMIHVEYGKYKEIDQAVLLPLFESIKCPDCPSEDEVFEKLVEIDMAEQD